MLDISPELKQLRTHFQTEDRDIRCVGGCVRDALCGLSPHDLDLATDASPDEQRAIYQQANVRHVATGLRHGTWTVILAKDQVYEITSLRTDTDHDGRHAKVTWTKDWSSDLARRDLTINAIEMTFDGEILDPFGGVDDLKQKRVRFVGNAAERMREDYLRILRFFRFHGRFGSHEYDQQALTAAQECAPGLATISRERVWSEIAKIISATPTLLLDIIDIGAHKYIGLPRRDQSIVKVAIARKFTQDPASLMAVYLGNAKAVQALAADWRWSTNERNQAVFIANTMHEMQSLHAAKLRIAVNDAPKHWVVETLRVCEPQLAQAIIEWTTPVFPVGGADLLALGIIGPKIGQTLQHLKTIWGDSKFRSDKTELLESLRS
jgi:tRNA nucleotidyltransferase (CCA-adding enzyme)